MSGVDQESAILAFLDQPRQGFVVSVLLPGAELGRGHRRSFLTVARPAQGLAIFHQGGSAVGERDPVIRVKTRFQGLTALRTTPGGDPGEDAPLPRGEAASHVFTQYSVS